MANEKFKADFAKLLAKAGDKAALVVRKTALELQSMMVESSPVGNPTLWLSLRPNTNLKTGRVQTELKPPAGYVGGRFKANWQPGVGAINQDTSSAIGDDANERTRIALESWKPGQTIYLTNSMDYSRELERGHSTQAPYGMVRLAVQRYSEAVAKAAAQIK